MEALLLYLVDTCSYSIKDHTTDEDVHCMRGSTYYVTDNQKTTSLLEVLAVGSVVPLKVRPYNQSYIAATDQIRKLLDLSVNPMQVLVRSKRLILTDPTNGQTAANARRLAITNLDFVSWVRIFCESTELTKSIYPSLRYHGKYKGDIHRISILESENLSIVTPLLPS